MEGRRQMFHCPKCGKGFWFWVQLVTAQPKVKCSFCGTESYPHGQPPVVAAPAPAPAPSTAPAAPGPAPVAPPEPVH